MSILYEHYNVGDNFENQMAGIFWSAQTFIPSVDHDITKVKLLLFRKNNPLNLTVGLRATLGGLPIGLDLQSYTFASALLPLAPTWWSCPMAPAFIFLAGIEYAIVPRETANLINWIGWRGRNAPPLYPDGKLLWSDDGGTTWNPEAGADLMFECWGNPVAPLPPRSRAHALSREEL